MGGKERSHDSHRTITKCVKFNSVILALPVLHELLCKLNSIGGTNDCNDPFHGARLGVIDGDVTRGLGSGVRGSGKDEGEQAINLFNRSNMQPHN